MAFFLVLPSIPVIRLDSKTTIGGGGGRARPRQTKHEERLQLQAKAFSRISSASPAPHARTHALSYYHHHHQPHPYQRRFKFDCDVVYPPFCRAPIICGAPSRDRSQHAYTTPDPNPKTTLVRRGAGGWRRACPCPLLLLPPCRPSCCECRATPPPPWPWPPPPAWAAPWCPPP